MEYLVKLDLFAWQVAQNQSGNNNGVCGDEKWAACLFHTDRVVREAIAAGTVQPVETTMGYPVNLTDPDASIKLSELAAYGKAKGIWWGDVPTMAKSLGFDVEPQALPAPVETISERRARLLEWHIEEQCRGRGAVQRVYEREKATKPKADRSAIGKDIRKAQGTAKSQAGASAMFGQLVKVKDGKRQ